MLPFRAVFIKAAMKKDCATSTNFQYLSAKLILFWVWPQPITRHETDIQKWLWPGLPAIATGAKKWNEKDRAQKTWLLLDQNS